MVSIVLGGTVLLIIFQNIIFTWLPLFSFVGYWDEGITIACIGLWIAELIRLRGKFQIKRKEYKIIMICLAALVILGLLSNCIFKYAYSVQAIIRDAVGFLKFPVTFLTMCYFGFNKKLVEYTKKYLIVILKAIVVIMLIFGVISLFWEIGLSHTIELRGGIYAYKFLFSHPTYLVLANVMILCIFASLEKKETLIYELMMCALIVLTMRTKGIAWVGVYVFIRLFGKWFDRFGRYKFIYWIAMLGVVFAFSISKIQLYLSYSNSPRQSMYVGAVKLLEVCFPIGSGFATYASHLSGRFKSAVYDFVQLAGVWRPDGSAGPEIGDAGFAYYMGQFGVIGCIIMAVLVYYIYKLATDGKKNRAVLCFFIYMAVALTSEALLINNGVEMAVILSMLAPLASCRDITVTTELERKAVSLLNAARRKAADRK